MQILLTQRSYSGKSSEVSSLYHCGLFSDITSEAVTHAHPGHLLQVWALSEPTQHICQFWMSKVPFQQKATPAAVKQKKKIPLSLAAHSAALNDKRTQ